MINFYIFIRGFSFNSYSKIHPNYQGVRIWSILYPYAEDKLEIREALFNLLICLLHKYAGMSKNEEDILWAAGKKMFPVSSASVFLLPDCYLQHHQIHSPQGLWLDLSPTKAR